MKAIVGIILFQAMTATSAFAQVAYTIDRATGDLALIHPDAPNNPFARIPIDFSAVSSDPAATIETSSGFDLTFANNRIYVLKYAPVGNNTSASYLFDVNIFDGTVSDFAQVVDSSGNPLTNASEGLAFDGSNVLVGYYSGGAGGVWSESNTVDTVDVTSNFGTLTTNNGFHAGNDFVDTDGLAACGDELIGVDNADNGTFNQVGVYDMGTAGNEIYNAAGFLPSGSNAAVYDLDFLADGRIVVIGGDTTQELMIYDNLMLAAPSDTVDLTDSNYDGIAVFKCGCNWICGPEIMVD